MEKHVEQECGAMTNKASKYPKHLADALALVLVSAGGTGWVLDSLSGSGIITKFVLKLGSQSRNFDIARSIEEDMLTMSFCRWLHQECRNGRVRGAMLPAPCRTVSVAQSRVGVAIRSQSLPRGTPGEKTARQQDSIQEGSSVLDEMG